MILIRVPNKTLQEVKNHLANGKKIQAIKSVREFGRKITQKDEEGSNKIGLKEAKYAVDSLNTGISNNIAKIVPAWSINSISVSGPCGEKIEMDIDTLQMHFLTTLSSVGLDEVARLCDLVEYIKEWECHVSSRSRFNSIHHVGENE